jgi:integrase
MIKHNLTTKNRVKIKLKKTSENIAYAYISWFKNGKQVWESTKLFRYINAETVEMKRHNKEVDFKLDIYRNRREDAFFKDEIEEEMDFKLLKNKNFHEYFKKYINTYNKEDLRVMKALANKLEEFSSGELYFKEIDENFCIKFKNYLSENMKGETPQTYFARFKKVITAATREGYFKTSPVQFIKNTSKNETIKKEVLTIEEIMMLYNTSCGNEMVKRAFLFSCNTGIRIGDLRELKWKNLRNNTLFFSQSKTQESSKTSGKMSMELNINAQNQLPLKEGNEFIFCLPSTNGVNKVLKNWAIKAGIEKHLTFHCSRHTFGTLLALYETDIYTIANLLGHSSLKHTTKYVRVSEELKKKAVNSIPKIEL